MSQAATVHRTSAPFDPFTLRISSSSLWSFSNSPTVLYCLYWPGPQCSFGVWICCPLAEATWFGCDFSISRPQNPKLKIEVFLRDRHLQERRPGHGTQGSLATVKGQTSPTGSRTKETVYQDHINVYISLLECETTLNFYESVIVDSGWLWVIFWLLETSLNMLRSNSGVEQGPLQEGEKGGVIWNIVHVYCLALHRAPIFLESSYDQTFGKPLKGASSCRTES